MSRFVLTAQLQLQAPTNARQVLGQIRNQLSGRPIEVPVEVRGAAQAAKAIQNVTKETQRATGAADALGRSFGLAVKRFAAFTVASRAVSLFTNSLASAVDEAIDFQREVVKIAQVTGSTVKELGGLEKTITRLSTGLGVVSRDLLAVTRILSQAGIRGAELEVALSSLAKSTLAPTFGEITQTAEGAIAVIRQFKQGVGALEGQLGSINAVAGQFAVEADDLIGAVRRFGGVFKSAGGNLEELLALFTSVRQTTRESAESISTGLRTIFTRVQRPETIQYLRELGVELTNAEGRFIGPFKAAQALGKAFADLPAGDTKFISIAEELGGFRQIGKVIPLLQQYKVAQEALNVAKAGQGSLDKDAATAQQALAVQITKVKEEFLALVRGIAASTSFQVFTRTALSLASAFIKIAETVKPLIPLLGAVAAFKFAQGFGSFLGGAGAAVRGLQTRNQGGRIHKFARGGIVPGTGNGDTVPAMLTPGEFVIRKSSVNKMGAGTLAAMNDNKFATGGLVVKQLEDKEFAGLFARPRGEDKGGTPVSIAGNPKGNEGEQTLAITGSPRSYFIGNTDEERFTKKADSVLRRGINEIVQGLNIDEKTANRADDNIIADIGVTDIAGKIFEGVTRAAIGDFRKGAGSQQSFDIPKGLDNDKRKTLGQLFGGGVLPNIHYDNKLSESRGNRASLLAKANREGLVRDVIQLTKFSSNKSTKDLIGLPKGDQRNTALSKRLDELKRGKAKLGDVGLEESTATLVERRLTGEIQKVVSAIPPSFAKKSVKKKASGGGISGSDTVPALLTPGEFVINKSAAASIGASNLNSMNKSGVAKFAKGGSVGGIQKFNGGGSAGGGGLDVGGIAKFGFALSAATMVVQTLGDTSEDASAAQFAIAKGGERLISSFTLLAGIIYTFGVTGAKSASFLEKFGASIDKTLKERKDKREAPAREAAGQGNLRINAINHRKQVLSSDLEGSKARVTDVKAQLSEEEFGAGVYPGSEEKLAKLRKELAKAERKVVKTTQDLVKIDLRKIRVEGEVKRTVEALTKEQMLSTRIMKRLKNGYSSVSSVMKKLRHPILSASAALKKLKASMRGIKSNPFATLGKGLGKVAGLAAVAVTGFNAIGTAVTGFIADVAQKAKEEAVKSGDAGAAAKQAGKQAQAEGFGEQFSFSGIANNISNAYEELGLIEGGGFAEDNKRRQNNIERAQFEGAKSAADVKVKSGLTTLENQKKRGKIDFAGISASIGKELAVAADEASDLEGPEGTTALASIQADASNVIDKFADSGASIDELKQSAMSLTVMNGTARESLLLQIKAIEAARNAQEQLTKANFDNLKVTSAFSLAANAVDGFTAGLQTGSNTVAIAMAELEAAQNTIGADTTGAIDKVESALLDSASGANPALTESITNQANVARGASGFNTGVGGALAGLNLKGDAGDKQLITKALIDVIPTNADADTKKALETAISAQVSQLDTGKAIDFKVLQEGIASQTKQLTAGLFESGKIQAAHNGKMIGLYKEREKIEATAAASLNQAIDTQIEAGKAFAEFGGARLTTQQQTQARVQQFNNIGGLGGLGANLRTGSADDIRRASTGISGTFNAQQQAGLGVFAGTKGVQDDKRPEARKANEALITFTKQRISLLKEEIGIVQAKNREEKSALEKLISGDVQGFIKGQAAAGAGAALRSGSSGLTSLFSGSALGAGFKSLEGQGLSDKENKRAADLTLSGLGITGGGAAGVLSGTTPEQEAIKAEGRELARVLGDVAGQGAQFDVSEIAIKDATITATNITFREKLRKVSNRNQGVPGFAQGGTVYASNGMFVPRGTDTVPAMLTPGEFVVNRSAVQRGNNLQMLRAMNTGGGASAPGHMRGGGRVRRNGGGPVEGSSNMLTDAIPALRNVFSDFSSAVDKLANTNFSVKLDTTNVNVNLVGGSFLESMKQNIKDELLAEVGREIGRTKFNSSGDLTRKGGVLA